MTAPTPPSNRAWRTLAMLVVGWWSSAVLADPVAFGSRQLDIPAPQAFHATAKDIPTLLELSQAYLPEGNRLVEIYLDEADRAAFAEGRQPELGRYFQLQVMRSMEGKPLSNDEFAEAADSILSDVEASVKSFDTKELTDPGNKALSEKSGSDAALSIGEVRYHGAFRREPWGQFFTTSSQVAMSGPDGSSGRMFSVGGVVLANHQIMYLFAFSKDNGPDARALAESALSQWADAVHAANPDDPAVAAQADATASRLIRNVSRGVLIGAGCGALIGLFAWFLRRKKR